MRLTSRSRRPPSLPSPACARLRAASPGLCPGPPLCSVHASSESLSPSQPARQPAGGSRLREGFWRVRDMFSPVSLVKCCWSRNKLFLFISVIRTCLLIVPRMCSSGFLPSRRSPRVTLITTLLANNNYLLSENHLCTNQKQLIWHRKTNDRGETVEFNKKGVCVLFTVHSNKLANGLVSRGHQRKQWNFD